MFYNVRTTSAEGTFRVTKFDADLNPVASYLTSAEGCECPAGVRPSCRHRDMVPVFAANGRIDTAWVCQWDTHTGSSNWRQFVGPLAANEVAVHIDLPPGANVAEEFANLISSAKPANVAKPDWSKVGDIPANEFFAAKDGVVIREVKEVAPSPIIDTARLRRILR